MYILTPWSRVLLEKLTGFAASQEIPRTLWNPNTLLNTLFSNTLSLRSSLNVSGQVSHPYRKRAEL